MQKIIDRLSRELNLPQDVIINTYKSYWAYIKNTIENLPLKEDLTEQDFNKLKVNFNIPNLGKLGFDYKRYLGVKKRNKLISRKNA